MLEGKKLIGTPVTINYGAHYGSEVGVIVDYVTSNRRAGDVTISNSQYVVRTDDRATDMSRTIGNADYAGIGVRLMTEFELSESKMTVANIRKV